MSSKDLSHSELIRKRKGLVLRVFKKNNPTKQLEGPNGITSHATYLAMQAYQGSITNLPDIPVCPSVLYSDIAENDDNVGAFALNEDTTILACQTLIIPFGVNFAVTTGKTLTNLGTINTVGTFFNTGTFDNAGTFISNGTTNNVGNSVFRNTGSIQITDTGNFGIAESASKLFNTGTIINSNFGVLTTGGSIYNYDGGRITNNGIFDNSGIIYNYNGGTIANNLSYSGDGLVYNPTTSGSCGVGILVNITADGTDCPPSPPI